jgi:hypothetical protein
LQELSFKNFTKNKHVPRKQKIRQKLAKTDKNRIRNEEAVANQTPPGSTPTTNAQKHQFRRTEKPGIAKVQKCKK